MVPELLLTVIPVELREIDVSEVGDTAAELENVTTITDMVPVDVVLVAAEDGVSTELDDVLKADSEELLPVLELATEVFPT